MAEFLLLLFPVAFVTILVVGARRRKNEEAASGAWNLDQAKALQAVAALMIILHHLVQLILCMLFMFVLLLINRKVRFGNQKRCGRD